MKNILKKIADILTLIVGYGLMLSLLVGGLSFFGYVIALIVGGDTATSICAFIYEDIFPWLFIVSAALVLLGLVEMYLLNETALSSSKKKKNK